MQHNLPQKKARILVIDNYDSFVYNLVHYLEELDCEVEVKRNDEYAIEEVSFYDKIVFSPGPSLPDNAGLMKKTIEVYAGIKPMLGVCLGHQAIAEVFGGKLENLDNVLHGVSSIIKLSENEIIFKGLNSEIEVGRYHSWIVSDKNFPEILKVTARDFTGQIMALRHKEFDICGVQFHPESILTPDGKEIIKNWIKG